jgi:hypothetical protein
VFNCFSKAERELQTGFLKPHGSSDGFSKATSGVYTDSQEAKAIRSSHAALEQPLTLQQEGLGKSVKIVKHFARCEIKLVN